MTLDRSSVELMVGVEACAEGRPVAILDPEQPGNVAVVCIAGSLVTDAHIRFLRRVVGGGLWLALDADQCARLGLDQLGTQPAPLTRAPLTPTIDARTGIGSGSSAPDQARTIRVASDPASTTNDIVVGGYVSPMRARPHGVLERPGFTEAAIDLARLASLAPAAVVCELHEAGEAVADPGRAKELCAEHEIPAIPITSLITARRRATPSVERVVSARMPTSAGEFLAVGYRCQIDSKEVVALTVGEVEGACGVLVHVHRACRHGDVFRSRLCDCRECLEHAMRAVQEAGRGVVVYMSAEPERAAGHAERDLRPTTLALAARVLADLAPGSVSVLGDEPDVVNQISEQGIEIIVGSPVDGG